MHTALLSYEKSGHNALGVHNIRSATFTQALLVHKSNYGGSGIDWLDNLDKNLIRN